MKPGSINYSTYSCWVSPGYCKLGSVDAHLSLWSWWGFLGLSEIHAGKIGPLHLVCIDIRGLNTELIWSLSFSQSWFSQKTLNFIINPSWIRYAPWLKGIQVISSRESRLRTLLLVNMGKYNSPWFKTYSSNSWRYPLENNKTQHSVYSIEI